MSNKVVVVRRYGQLIEHSNIYTSHQARACDLGRDLFDDMLRVAFTAQGKGFPGWTLDVDTNNLLGNDTAQAVKTFNGKHSPKHQIILGCAAANLGSSQATHLHEAVAQGSLRLVHRIAALADMRDFARNPEVVGVFTGSLWVIENPERVNHSEVAAALLLPRILNPPL